MSDKDTIIGQPVERRADWIEQGHVTPPVAAPVGQQGSGDAVLWEAITRLERIDLATPEERLAAANGLRDLIAMRGTEGQQDAGASVLTDAEIVQFANDHDDRECGLQAFPFARAIEAEVASRCRVQGGITQQSPDWLAYHSALSASAELLDNMADGDPITDLPKFLAAKLASMAQERAAVSGPSLSSAEIDAIIRVLRSAPAGPDHCAVDSAARYLQAWRSSRPAAPVAQEGGFKSSTLGNLMRVWATLYVASDANAVQAYQDVLRYIGQPTPSDSASVDTAELRMLAQAWSDAATECWPSKTLEGWVALIAHIESLIAAQVAGVRKDAERLDLLETMVENGCVTMCFELDGGIHLTLEGVSEAPIAYRNKDNVRAALDAARAAHSPASGSKEGGAA